MINYFLLILSLFLIFAPVKSSYAGQNLNLYDVTMPVTSESRAVRGDAFAHGLEEVFVRLSGDSTISSKLKLPAASRYVKQYSYQPIARPEVNEEGELLNFLLTVHYNGSRVVDALRKNGFPIWGEHRADLVIWVAVRDGRTQYVLKNTDSSLIKIAIDKALKRRGVPPRWPVYDNRDSSVLSFSDIRGGFRDPLQTASARYTKGPILSISLSWNGRIWHAEWTLLLKKSEHRGNDNGKDYNKLIQQMMNQVVDTMGQSYAINELKSGQEAEPVYIDVSGVNTVVKYKYVDDYLSSMSAVKAVQIMRVDGAGVEFKLDLRSDTDDFLMLLKNDAKLIAVNSKPDKSMLTQVPAQQSLELSSEHRPADKTLLSIKPAINKTLPSIQTQVGLKPEMTGAEKLAEEIKPSNATETGTQIVKKRRKKLIYYFRL